MNKKDQEQIANEIMSSCVAPTNTQTQLEARLLKVFDG